MINFTAFLIVVIISSVFGVWLEAILLFIGVMPIRLVAGGYHAKTPQRCNVLSLIVFVLNMWLIQMFEMFIAKEVSTVICILILLIIFCFAPVDHKNRVLKKEDYMKSKRQSRLIALILAVFCIGMTLTQRVNQIITLSIIMGALTVSISLVIGSIVRGGERNEKNESLAQKGN